MPTPAFEKKVSAQSRQAIITGPALAAVEIDKPEEMDLYSAQDQGDGSEQRRALLEKRAEMLGEGSMGGPAKLLFSDAHSPAQIGRDREGQDRVTRIKMSEPSFAAFRTALADPDARIKLEAEVAGSYPRILGARFIGGFLDSREIAFSPNLTCLIGGRGAGKSTALESVRAACLSTSSEIDGEPNCPETVQLVYRDEYGSTHYLKRDSEKTTYELSEAGATETHVAIEGYGQDRVASIIRGYPGEPRPLLAFLDQFVDLQDVTDELADLAERLGASAAAIAPLATAPKRKAEAEKKLAETRVKLKALGESNLKTALQWRQKLQRERRLRGGAGRASGSDRRRDRIGRRLTETTGHGSRGRGRPGDDAKCRPSQRRERGLRIDRRARGACHGVGKRQEGNVGQAGSSSPPACHPFRDLEGARPTDRGEGAGDTRRAAQAGN